MPISRRELLATAAATSLTSLPVLSIAQDKPVPPPLNPDLVRDFVIAAHKSLDAVKPLLEETPALLNATIDWRAGDFESAIGGAGHMGHRDIAQFLIEKGARTDLFVHTMLGHTDVVRPMLTRYPQMVECKGPHGISLARHAEAGGEPAKELLDFIKSLIRSAKL
ncbi:MAG: hypothetical protein KF743_03520 [Fimbriimonadaceae bacterium]|nr:hypothetical protein [Fimbriimonadaceae bacterium]